MRLNLTAISQTDVGLRRELNEDSFLVDEELGLFVVADGMGGHQGGEVASKMAVETIKEVIERSIKDKRRNPPPRMLLAEAYAEASRRIFDYSQRDESAHLHGMGTTLVSVYRSRDSVFVANVGDSRCYLSVNDNLWQLTEDHSLINELLRSGQINESEVEKFVAKNVITRSVGFERDVSPDIVEKHLDPGDRYLICSDGLSGLVNDKTIAEILKANSQKPDRAVHQLIEKAKESGGDDNVTAVLIEAK